MATASEIRQAVGRLRDMLAELPGRHHADLAAVALDMAMDNAVRAVENEEPPIPRCNENCVWCDSIGPR